MSTTSAKTRRGGHTILIIAAIVGIVATLGAAGLAMRNMGNGDDGRSASDSFVVRRGNFDITIPTSGELAALKQIEIRNRVDGRSTIMEIVAEGTFVNPGDVLLRLNDDEIRAELRQSQDEVNTAEAALVTAEAELAITLKTREAELAKADLAIMLADLALKAWAEGEDPAKRQELALAVESADKDYARLEARFAESAKLLDKKFISLDEYKRDEIAMIDARARLARARLDVDVYAKYQSSHDRAQKESDLEQARSERERIEEQYNAEVRSAEIEVTSRKFQLESAMEERAEEQEQLEYCTVIAPSAGLVVYYSSLQQGGGGRNDGRPPQVGTELTKNEAVMVLPDTSQMIASVKVSEALTGMIRAGQRATIVSDAIPGQTLTGDVSSVGILAESGGWRDPNRRDYTVKILLRNGHDLGLKPSMRCKAEIYVGRVSSALYAPIQAVFRNGPLTYAYVPQGRGYAQKQVEIGRVSELYVEIKDGLGEGDVVLLREPPAQEIVYRLPTPQREAAEDDEPDDLPEAPEMLGPPSGGVPFQGGDGTGNGGGMRGGGQGGMGPGGMGGGRGGGRVPRDGGGAGENGGADRERRGGDGGDNPVSGDRDNGNASGEERPSRPRGSRPGAGAGSSTDGPRTRGEGDTGANDAAAPTSGESAAKPNP